MRWGLGLMVLSCLGLFASGASLDYNSPGVVNVRFPFRAVVAGTVIGLVVSGVDWIIRQHLVILIFLILVLFILFNYRINYIIFSVYCLHRSTADGGPNRVTLWPLLEMVLRPNYNKPHNGACPYPENYFTLFYSFCFSPRWGTFLQLLYRGPRWHNKISIFISHSSLCIQIIYLFKITKSVSSYYLI